MERERERETLKELNISIMRLYCQQMDLSKVRCLTTNSPSAATTRPFYALLILANLHPYQLLPLSLPPLPHPPPPSQGGGVGGRQVGGLVYWYASGGLNSAEVTPAGGQRGRLFCHCWCHPSSWVFSLSILPPSHPPSP